jgi:hypothetical protein
VGVEGLQPQQRSRSERLGIITAMEFIKLLQLVFDTTHQ